MSQLFFPGIEWRETYLSGLKECLDEGLPVKVNYDEAAADFLTYVKKIEAKKLGIGLPEGYSPETELWLIDNGEYIGTVKIRHKLNKKLMATEGHMGYYIRPKRRKMGYGKKILKLAVLKAEGLGIRDILLACDETNIGSRRVIEANGGVLEDVVSNGDGKPRRLRFWITK